MTNTPETLTHPDHPFKVGKVLYTDLEGATMAANAAAARYPGLPAPVIIDRRTGATVPVDPAVVYPPADPADPFGNAAAR